MFCPVINNVPDQYSNTKDNTEKFMGTERIILVDDEQDIMNSTKKILSLRKDIPVILCTGFHETFTEEDAIQMGIRRYFQKPVSKQALISAIRDELE